MKNAGSLGSGGNWAWRVRLGGCVTHFPVHLLSLTMPAFSTFFRSLLLSGLAVAVAALVTPRARAQAVVTWQSAHFITGDSDVSLNGTLVWAYNFGAGGTNPTINGVTFTGTNSGSPGVTLTTVGSSFFNNAAAFKSTQSFYTSLSSGYQTLLQSASYWSGNTSNTQTMRFNDLIPGATYQFQVWVNDSRGLHAGLSVTFSDQLGNVGSVLYNNNGASLGQYIIGTFTAVGTTETLALGPYSPQMNAASLRLTAIPEPSTYAALAGAAVFGVVIYRRRRPMA